jgi:uncharacterized membrane protein YdjX (TVP38/TMEM64 family)
VARDVRPLSPPRPVALPERTVRWLRVVLVLIPALLFALLYLVSDGFRGQFNRALAILGSGDIEGLQSYILSYGVLAPLASSFLMVLQAIAAPVPSFLITFANGLAFGTFWGWVLSLFGHTLAAAVCFWISRAFGRVPVEILVGKAGLESADRWFARWGTYAVFAGRLIPGISFDIISYAAGLTRMRFTSFLVATALGIAPQTLFYSYLGWQAPQYAGFFLVFSVVVVAAVVGTAVYRRRKRRRKRKYDLL